MGSRRSYSDEEIRRILEEEEEIGDFSDSDEIYEPDGDEDEDSSSSEDEEEDQEAGIQQEAMSSIESEVSGQVGSSYCENNTPIEEESVTDPVPSIGYDSNEDTVWVEDVLPIGRESFIGKSGLQNVQAVSNEDGSITIEKIMEYFISDDIIDFMVEKTNSYAELYKMIKTKRFSRMSRWVEVDREAMKKFFAIIIYMGINKRPSIEYYWKKDPLYYCDFIHRISISYNRFANILRCWHFEDVQPDNDNVLYRIQPLVDKMVEKFRSLYVPSDTLVVDESQINHQGRLKIKTYNPSKTHKYGIKIYKMCSTSSYTWSYAIHAGSGSALEGLDKPGSVVAKLCLPLLNEGRLIVADNYYTGLALAKYLKERNTDLCGTLRKNKLNLPKSVIENKLRRGDVVARQMDAYVTVLKWHDKRDVLMMSTCHGKEMTNVSSWRGETSKPNMVIDYNEAKKGIDVADQLSSYYSLLRKSITWYKKIAYDLLFQAAIVNTKVIFSEATGSTVTILHIQETMIRHWLGAAVMKKQSSRASTGTSKGRHALTQIPRKDNKLVRRRCVTCYAKNKAAGNPLKTKQVNTECLECAKSFCLSCFNEVH